MIPKIIHCCWLSGGPKPELAEKCLASWRKYAPGWEIREWDMEKIGGRAEGVGLPEFVRNAIAAKKWAFAADWVRFKALHDEGGVYFDLDFELVRPIDELPEGEWCAGQWLPDGRVAPEPAAMALERSSPIAAEMLAYYEKAAFDDRKTVGEILDWLREKGDAICVLPPEVMSPIDNAGRMHRTEKTVGIHWYAMSWAGPKARVLQWISWHGGRPLIDALLKVKRKLTGRRS